MRAKYFIAAALAAVVAAPAMAQTDMVTTNFTGPRLEGRVGYEFTSVAIRDVRDFQGRGQFGTSPSGEEVTAGVEAGFDFQTMGLVFGAYAGVDFADLQINSPRQPVVFDTGRNITAGVRAGMAVRDDVLLYVKGGYSNGRLTPVFGSGTTAAQQAQFNNYDRNRNGFHVGGGVELPVMGNFYARADYTFTRYERFTLNPNDELRFSRHQLMGGVGIRF